MNSEILCPGADVLARGSVVEPMVGMHEVAKAVDLCGSLWKERVDPNVTVKFVEAEDLVVQLAAMRDQRRITLCYAPHRRASLLPEPGRRQQQEISHYGPPRG